LSTWANEQEKNQNVQNENNNDTNANYETFIVDRNSSNQKYIIHNFRVDYQHKFIHFNSLCPYEFSSKINKINNIHCHRFNNEHLQYNTKILHRFKELEILVLQSYTIHSPKNEVENYAQAFCILFTLWHTIFDIKSDLTISWEMTLNNVYPTFIDLHETII
jgi:hypothetical protein